MTLVGGEATAIRCFGVFAVTVAVLLYAVGLRAPFYLDDPEVLANARLTLGPRGLGLSSFRLNDQVDAIVQVVFPVADPVLFRLANVLIHAAAATALFWLAFELVKKWAIAWAAATLFLVHPIQTQAVTYIAQRFESQATLLMLLSAAAYARFRNRDRRGWFVLSMICGIAAALTKETAIILPVWILMIDAMFFSGGGIGKRAPYLVALAILLSAPAFIAFSASGDTLLWIPWHRYFLTQGPVLAKYLQLVVWPSHQFLFYDFPLVQGFSLVVLAKWMLVLAVLAFGFFCLRRDRVIGFGILTFFTLLLPVTLLPLPNILFEHRVYPAMAGVALAAGAGLSQLPGRTGLALFLLAVAPLQYRTMHRNREWTDPVRFFEAHRERFPSDPIILANLGVEYANRGMVDKALEASLTARQFEDRANRYYRKQVAVVIATTLGFQYLQKRQLDDAVAEAQRIRTLDPANAGGLMLLGEAQLARNDRAGARETYQTMVNREPQNRQAWVRLRNTLDPREDPERVREVERRLQELAGAPPPLRARLQISPVYRMQVSIGLAVLALLIVLAVARTLHDARHSIPGLLAATSR